MTRPIMIVADVLRELGLERDGIGAEVEYLAATYCNRLLADAGPPGEL